MRIFNPEAEHIKRVTAIADDVCIGVDKDDKLVLALNKVVFGFNLWYAIHLDTRQVQELVDNLEVFICREGKNG